MDSARERQIADALEALLPVLEHDASALRSVRRLLGVLASQGPEGLRADATRLSAIHDKGLRDGAAAIARALRGRQLGAVPTPILIVEDDDLVAAAVALHLAPLGREILIATELEGAVKHLHDGVSAVVLDLQLDGEEDGRDLLASWSEHTPFIVLSSLAGTPAVQAECRALGARAVLPKPAQADSLIATLQSVLGELGERDDQHVIALLRQRAHLDARDVAALAAGIGDLTWDAAVRTHLAQCDQCRELVRRGKD